MLFADDTVFVSATSETPVMFPKLQSEIWLCNLPELVHLKTKLVINQILLHFCPLIKPIYESKLKFAVLGSRVV